MRAGLKLIQIQPDGSSTINSAIYQNNRSPFIAACRLLIAALMFLLTFPLHAAAPQAVNGNAMPQPANAVDWINAAVENQLKIVSGDGQYMRYLEHRHDSNMNRNQVRDVVETREGFESRAIEMNGKPLTSDEDAAETQKLKSKLENPDDQTHHHKREQADLAYTKKLISQLPSAMIWTFVPAESNADVVVLDYAPNPAYHPPSAETVVLQALTGRIWIDAHSHIMTKIDAKVEHDAKYGWGLGYDVYGGGTISLEQHPIENGIAGHPHWETTRFMTHVSGTFLVFKHFNFNVVELHDHFTPVHGSPSYIEGLHMLLDTPAPTK
jgi:hypothetical protein